MPKKQIMSEVLREEPGGCHLGVTHAGHPWGFPCGKMLWEKEWFRTKQHPPCTQWQGGSQVGTQQHPGGSRACVPLLAVEAEGLQGSN